MHRLNLSVLLLCTISLVACGGSGGESTSGVIDSIDVPIDNPNSNEDLDSNTDDVESILPEEKLLVPVNVDYVGVANWKNNATAAYSIIHDDFCAGVDQSSDGDGKDGIAENWTELKDRGLVAGFGVVVSWCGKSYNGKSYFQIMKEMEDNGMEIINHSYSHPSENSEGLTGNYPNGDPVDLDAEINDADIELKNRGFQNVTYFAFPQDIHTPEMLVRLKDELNYLGARGGEHDVNPTNMEHDEALLAPFRANFDCFNQNQTAEHGYNCSGYSRDSTGDTVDPLKYYLDEAIKSKGWGLRELHGIGVRDSWGWVTEQEYITHLDYVQSKQDAGDVWMGTPTNVTKYWASRTYCGEPDVRDNKIEFSEYYNTGGCLKYSTPLDVMVSALTEKEFYGIQDGVIIEPRSIGSGEFILEVNPVGGTVELFEKN